MRTFLILTAGGSVMILLLLLLKALLGKRLGSTAYYYAWLLVLLRFLLPAPGFLPIDRAQPAAAAPTEERSSLSLSSFPGGEQNQASDRDYEGFWLNVMQLEEISPTPAAEAAAGVSRARSFNWKSPSLWIGLWAAGACVSFLLYTISYVLFRRRLGRSLLPASGRDLAVYDGFPGRKPELLRCSGVKTPLLCGVLHPMLLLPDQKYDTEVLSNILCHELMHYRRRDTLYKWFALAVYSVQWFNPLVYLMRRELNRACELSCDEMLMRTMDRHKRKSYGETLLTMAEKASMPTGIIATTFTTEKENLKERLEQIMEFKPDKKKLLSTLLVLVLLMTCAVLTGPKSSAEESSVPLPQQAQITVSTVDELLDAIAPDTCIVLKEGTYDLSKASSYGGPQRGAYWRWEEMYDGYELLVEDLSNLTIMGTGMDGVTISAVPRYADVLQFVRCSNITVQDFTAGHTEAPATCAGNVLAFDNCRGISVASCSLYGCGVLGIEALNCTDLTVTESHIYDCSYGAAALDSCRNVVFENCTIRDHGGIQEEPVGYLFHLNGCEAVTVKNSVIRNNYAQNLLVTGYSRNVVFAGNTVENNAFLSAVFSSQRNSPVVEGCSFTGNSIYTWYDGNGVFAVNAEGKTLGREELESMARREISPEENLFSNPADAEKTALVEPDPADGAYHVSTVDELLSAIGNDRTIVLEAELYDLSTASDYGAPGGEYYFWKEDYDGPGLVITGVHNLTIDASKTETDQAALHHTITATPRYADVMSFQYCDEISLLNFTAGHTIYPGQCSGGVLSFRNCSIVYLGTCRLYGCGILGVQADNCSTIMVNSCEIYDCSQGGAAFSQTDNIIFNDCSIHDVTGPALTFWDCGSRTWNGIVYAEQDMTLDVDRNGDLVEFDWDTYYTSLYPEEVVEPESNFPAHMEEMNPVLAKKIAEGELKRLQELGILSPEISFEGTLESAFYTDGSDVQFRTSTHGFYAQDYSGNYFINFRIDDTSTGDVRSASIEAAAGEDDEVTGSVEWGGETYYYYDNFDDIFPSDLTVGRLCDLLAQYWGYGSWTLADTWDEFYGENFTAPDPELLLKDLPEGNYYATVYFEGDQEGAPMFFQKMHFPGRVCFIFGEAHAVG